MGRFSGHAFFGTVRRAVAPPCLSTRTRSDSHFPDLAGACARGGGYTAHKKRQFHITAPAGTDIGRLKLEMLQVVIPVLQLSIGACLRPQLYQLTKLVCYGHIRRVPLQDMSPGTIQRAMVAACNAGPIRRPHRTL